MGAPRYLWHAEGPQDCFPDRAEAVGGRVPCSWFMRCPCSSRLGQANQHAIETGPTCAALHRCTAHNLEGTALHCLGSPPRGAPLGWGQGAPLPAKPVLDGTPLAALWVALVGQELALHVAALVRGLGALPFCVQLFCSQRCRCRCWRARRHRGSRTAVSSFANG